MTQRPKAHEMNHMNAQTNTSALLPISARVIRLFIIYPIILYDNGRDNETGEYNGSGWAKKGKDPVGN